MLSNLLKADSRVIRVQAKCDQIKGCLVSVFTTGVSVEAA